jgi:hypothetical protein
MPSGAGHDAEDMVHIVPTGMIFVPSVGRISHSPKEYAAPKDVRRERRRRPAADRHRDRRRCARACQMIVIEPPCARWLARSGVTGVRLLRRPTGPASKNQARSPPLPRQLIPRCPCELALRGRIPPELQKNAVPPPIQSHRDAARRRANEALPVSRGCHPAFDDSR